MLVERSVDLRVIPPPRSLHPVPALRLAGTPSMVETRSQRTGCPRLPDLRHEDRRITTSSSALLLLDVIDPTTGNRLAAWNPEKERP
jgi:hypothetical protein